ncbi:MAG: hypothetical protein WA885_02265 [Phormidesmis sp.]
MMRYEDTTLMIGHVVKSVAGHLSSSKGMSEGMSEGSSEADASGYRLEQLLAQQESQRTFLAIDTDTCTKVVVELQLFKPGVCRSDLNMFKQAAEKLRSLAASTIPPYTDFFTVDTPIGQGFALVRPYVEVRSDRSVLARSPAFAPLELSPQSISTVRSGLAAKPRTLRGDFKVRSTYHFLEVRFSRDRIRTGIPDNTSPSEEGLLAIAAALSTVIFVGGAVIVASSIIAGVIVAALLPMVFKLIKSSKAKERPETATLKLTRGPDGGTWVSLTTVLVARNRKESHALGHAIAEGTPHFVQLPLRSLTVKTGFFGSQVSLILNEKTSRNRRLLRIAGSPQDIRWLCAHFARWDKNRVG